MNHLINEFLFVIFARKEYYNFILRVYEKQNTQHITNLILPTVICYFNSSKTTKAQEWSEPITIFQGTSTSRDVDITIDNNNHIHVVWEYKVGDNFGKYFIQNLPIKERHGVSLMISLRIPLLDVQS